MENEVLLVGNGRSLLDRRGLGARIDSFATVVRFNNFMTTGFEPFVGTRTNWWARAENPDILPRLEPLRRILLRLQGEDAEAFQKGAADLVPHLQQQYPETPVDVIPRDVFTDLSDECGFAHAPLTGTLVIAYLLRTLPRVYVCGFDNLAGTPETLRHYFSEGNVIGDWTTYHEPDKEIDYLRRRIEEGCVVPIDAHSFR